MNLLLSSTQLDLIIRRLAQELTEGDDDIAETVFIGLQPRGVYISDRIIAAIRELCAGANINYGVLDITFYRDDVRNEFHAANKTEIPFSIDGKKVVLIDDVLYTGRTIRAALDAIQDFGRPRKVELCVLVDRHFDRELPIRPDHCGKTTNSRTASKIIVDRERGEVVVQ